MIIIFILRSFLLPFQESTIDAKDKNSEEEKKENILRNRLEMEKKSQIKNPWEMKGRVERNQEGREEKK